jgi:hypothetical protein
MRIRDIVRLSSWLKDTLFFDTALYNFTGMLTRPS